jgi:uncharacterized protein
VHPEAQRIISAFRLQAHPEGGWYRETYRSTERVTTSRGSVRSATTSIYFLLTAETTIVAGAHFAAHVDAPGGYALVGCDVAPGFEFADFQLTTRSMLTAAYPHLGPLIARYTR